VLRALRPGARNIQVTGEIPPGREPGAAGGPRPPAPRAGGDLDEREALPRGRRWVLFLVGWVFFALGAAGTVLPLLPATPLLLVSLWAFSASSERFHRWLWHHRVFGPLLQGWKRDRVIPLRAKLIAVVSMVASLLYVGLVRRSSPWVLAAMVALMIPGIVFITRFPSRRPGPGERPGAVAGPAAPPSPRA
jgi:uncharacterized membrane protein YbaN (DUF454 family)